MTPDTPISDAELDEWQALCGTALSHLSVPRLIREVRRLRGELAELREAAIQLSTTADSIWVKMSPGEMELMAANAAANSVCPPNPSKRMDAMAESTEAILALAQAIADAIGPCSVCGKPVQAADAVAKLGDGYAHLNCVVKEANSLCAQLAAALERERGLKDWLVLHGVHTHACQKVFGKCICGLNALRDGHIVLSALDARHGGEGER